MTLLNLSMAASLQWLSAYLPRDTFLLGFFVELKKQIGDLWVTKYSDRAVMVSAGPAYREPA